jgi:hypothetical protein
VVIGRSGDTLNLPLGRKGNQGKKVVGGEPTALLNHAKPRRRRDWVAPVPAADREEMILLVFLIFGSRPRSLEGAARIEKSLILKGLPSGHGSSGLDLARLPTLRPVPAVQPRA